MKPLTRDELAFEFSDAMQTAHYQHCKENACCNSMTDHQVAYIQGHNAATESLKLSEKLHQAFQLGQDYWRQADSESYKQNALSKITRAKFDELLSQSLTSEVVK